MPLINTSIDQQTDSIIDEMLVEAGLDKPKTLQVQLKENGLETSELLQSLASIARNGQTENNQLRAIEMGLKLNGLMQTNVSPTAPMFQVIIQDPNARVEINPILIPRR